MSEVYVAGSGIHGEGVFAGLDIEAGEQILTMDDSREVTETSPLREGESKDHCDWLAGGKVVLLQPPERFINHSCDPNSFVQTMDGVRHIVAHRDIPLERRSPTIMLSTATAMPSGNAGVGANGADRRSTAISFVCPTRCNWSICHCLIAGSWRRTKRRSKN